MKALRPTLATLLALLFTALVAFWIFHVPLRPLALYKSIPAHADLIGVHDNLADRLAGLMENDLFARMLASSGLTREQVEAMSSDPGSRVWLDRIASKHCVIARLPPESAASGPAWCLAAWMGSESVRLRWSLGLSADKDCRAGAIAGTQVWRFRLEDLPLGHRLYCAVEEGVLLAAVSSSPNAIHQMILAYQGRYESYLDRHPEIDFPAAEELQARPDQFYFSAGPDLLLNIRFSRLSAEGLKGVLGLAGAEDDPPPTDMPRPQTLEWQRPMLHALLTPAAVAQIGAAFDRQSWAALALSLTSRVQSGPLFVGFFGGEQQGRLKGFRIPGILLAMPVKDEDEALRLFLSRIDRINAINSLGIIHHRIDIADTSIYRLEGTRDNLYGKLPPDEQLAFMLRNGFLLVGSHPQLLRSIALDELLASDNPVWNDLKRKRPNSLIQADIERSAKALRLALAVYSLKMVSESPDASRRIRERIDLVEDWIEACTPFGDCLIWDPEQDQSKYIGFELGR